MKKLLLLLPFIMIFYAQETYAQQFHVSIEPTVIQIDATPPANFQAPFLIKNLSSATIILTPKLIPFEPKADGKIRLLINEGNSLADIIKDRLVLLDEEKMVNIIELGAGETKQLRLFMNLVKGDPVGDYYFSLVFISEGTTLEDTSTSALPAGIATNIMLSIGPKIAASGEIEELSTKRFISSGPVALSLKLKNTGKHLIQPSGTISIKNMLGKEVGNLKLQPQYVLSKSSRYLIDEKTATQSAGTQSMLSSMNLDNPSSIWSEKFLMGAYTATAKLTLEKGGAVVTETTTFYAIPVQIIAIISGMIFVILGIFLRIKYKLRLTRP